MGALGWLLNLGFAGSGATPPAVDVQQALHASQRDFVLTAHKKQTILTASERDFTLRAKQ